MLYVAALGEWSGVLIGKATKHKELEKHRARTIFVDATNTFSNFILFFP